MQLKKVKEKLTKHLLTSIGTSIEKFIHSSKKRGNLFLKIFATNQLFCDTPSKETLIAHFKPWADSQKRIDLEIRSACIESDYRYLTQLIELYCGDQYRQINAYLRYKEDLDHFEFREKAHLLTLIVYNAPRLHQDFVVYRSICQEFIRELHLKGVAFEKGFMSTTFDFQYALNYKDGDSILKIHVPPETPFVYTDIIKNREESELLFPPNAGLTLISQPQKVFNTGKMIYECTMFYY